MARVPHVHAMRSVEPDLPAPPRARRCGDEQHPRHRVHVITDPDEWQRLRDCEGAELIDDPAIVQRYIDEGFLEYGDGRTVYFNATLFELLIVA